MATVRFYRGHWVADYYDTNKRRRIERPKGHFENLTDQLRAAQALLADQTGVHRSPAESEAWSRRSPRETTGKSGEDQHSLDQQGAHRSQHGLQLCDA
jgi:hypothetical protein